MITQYTPIGKKICRIYNGKLYWFTEWYRSSKPFIEYPDRVIEHLPIIPKQELFARQLKDPESVLIR